MHVSICECIKEKQDYTSKKFLISALIGMELEYYMTFDPKKNPFIVDSYLKWFNLTVRMNLIFNY